jgi:hypothetical protein
MMAEKFKSLLKTILFKSANLCAMSWWFIAVTGYENPLAYVSGPIKAGTALLGLLLLICLYGWLAGTLWAIYLVVTSLLMPLLFPLYLFYFAISIIDLSYDLLVARFVQLRLRSIGCLGGFLVILATLSAICLLAPKCSKYIPELQLICSFAWPGLFLFAELQAFLWISNPLWLLSRFDVAFSEKFVALVKSQIEASPQTVQPQAEQPQTEQPEKDQPQTDQPPNPSRTGELPVRSALYAITRIEKVASRVASPRRLNLVFLILEMLLVIFFVFCYANAYMLVSIPGGEPIKPAMYLDCFYYSSTVLVGSLPQPPVSSDCKLLVISQIFTCVSLLVFGIFAFQALAVESAQKSFEATTIQLKTLKSDIRGLSAFVDPKTDSADMPSEGIKYLLQQLNLIFWTVW